MQISAALREELCTIADENPLSSVRTGCPALYARTPEGVPVIKDLHSWSLALADKMFFPHVGPILERGWNEHFTIYDKAFAAMKDDKQKD